MFWMETSWKNTDSSFAVLSKQINEDGHVFTQVFIQVVNIGFFSQTWSVLSAQLYLCLLSLQKKGNISLIFMLHIWQRWCRLLVCVQISCTCKLGLPKSTHFLLCSSIWHVWLYFLQEFVKSRRQCWCQFHVLVPWCCNCLSRISARGWRKPLCRVVIIPCYHQLQLCPGISYYCHGSEVYKKYRLCWEYKWYKLRIINILRLTSTN